MLSVFSRTEASNDARGRAHVVESDRGHLQELAAQALPEGVVLGHPVGGEEAKPAAVQDIAHRGAHRRAPVVGACLERWNDSRIVREGIKALGALAGPNRPRKIAGVERFRSGVPDLGSNKRHLRGFGR